MTQEGHVPHFKLTVKNDDSNTFIVPAMDGTTLLDALLAFEKTTSDFSFETSKLPGGGLYVVAVTVNGHTTKAGINQFWGTLHNNAGNITPIGLSSYHVHHNDHIDHILLYFVQTQGV